MGVIKVSAAIIEREGRIFCAHRSTSKAGPGWEFPGGAQEEGETAEQCVRRELLEELDAELSTAWLFDTVTYDYPTFTIVMDCFVCRLAEGGHIELREHDEGRWIGRDELLELDWLPADREVVQSLGRFWDQAFAAEHL